MSFAALRLSLTATCLALVWGSSGCASKVAPLAQNSPGPFIKLAQREMVVLVHTDSALSFAEQDVFISTLLERLNTIYGAPVSARRQPALFRSIAPEDLAEFALAGIDDAVVVEASFSAGVDSPLHSRVRVINLAQLVTTVDVTTPGVRAGRGPDRGQRLAETVARRLSQRWTDPGAAPTMDPLRAADRLADNQACRMAVRIYESVLPERRPTTVVDMASYQATQERYDRCREEVRLADLLAEDARATFSLEIDAESMAPRIAKAMQDALPESGLTEALPRWTNKPASVHAEPGFLSLDFRYDPAPYRAATARRPQYESRGQPILYLDPFLALIDGLVALREAAIARLPPYDRLNLRELQTQIRFHRLPDDRITLVFSDLDGRLLIADSLLVKVGYRPEVKVDSVRSGVSRSLRFWLGPPEDEAGDITDYGLVFRFFGLE